MSGRDTPMTTAGLQAKVRLRRAWFEAHPNQPLPEGRVVVERLFAAVEAEARLVPAVPDVLPAMRWALNRAEQRELEALAEIDRLRADAVPVDSEGLARVIHDGRIAVAKHGKFTDRCICNALADAILRGLSKMVPKPSLDKVIAEFALAPRQPSRRKRIDWSDVVVDEGDEAP